MNQAIRRIRVELSQEQHHSVRMAAAAFDLPMSVFAKGAVMAAAVEANRPRTATQSRPPLPKAGPPAVNRPSAKDIFGDCAELQPMYQLK